MEEEERQEADGLYGRGDPEEGDHPVLIIAKMREIWLQP